MPTECYMKETCGICGYYTGNNNGYDDFRFRIDYDNTPSNDALSFGYISTEEVWDGHSLDPWQRSQNFTLYWLQQSEIYANLSRAKGV